MNKVELNRIRKCFPNAQSKGRGCDEARVGLGVLGPLDVAQLGNGQWRIYLPQSLWQTARESGLCAPMENRRIDFDTLADAHTWVAHTLRKLQTDIDTALGGPRGGGAQ